MVKVDTIELARTIDECFDFAMDDRLSLEQQKKYLAEGKRLRANLLNLVTARFTEDTQEVLAANSNIKAINRQLNAATQDLAKTAATLEQLGELVAALDGLLSLAVKFV